MFKRKSWKLFIIVSVFVALIDLAFVYMNYHFSERAFKQSMVVEGDSLHINFQTLLSQTYTNTLTIATFIASDSKIQQAFLKGKRAVEKEGGGAGGVEAKRYREALYSMVGDKWAEVQKKFSARQLHFHLGPGSTSFLRVHKPDKYGDNMDDVRFTIVDTNKEKLPRTGFETGRVYSGLRGVVPVPAYDAELQKRVHVGALEVGTSFNVILKILQETSNYSAGVLLTQQHIKGSMWRESIEKRFGAQDLKCECVIEANSDENFKEVIVAGRDKGISYREGGHELIEVDGQSFLMSYFPIRDYQGERDKKRADAGAVVFWKNIEPQLSALRTAHLYNIIYGVIGFILIELLFLIAFHFGTKRLENAIDKASQEINIHKDRLLAAQELANIGNWEWDLVSDSLWWSAQIYELLELDQSRDVAKYETYMERVHPDDRARMQAEIDDAISSGKNYSVEHRIVLPSGGEIQVLARGSVDRNSEGEPVIFKGTVQDITELKKAQMNLSEVIWATNVGTWDLDVASGALSVNTRWAEMMGYSVKELTPLTMSSWGALICPEDLDELRSKVQNVVKCIEPFLQHEFKVRHKEGQWVWVLARGRVVERSVSGDSVRVSGSTVDITQRKSIELKIQRLATIDALTGLNNRSVFNDKLNEQIRLAKRLGTVFAVMMLDLDEFKPVNDQYGHPVGDELLKQVSADIKSECRDTDIVARLGGDEFAFILLSTTDHQGCKAFAERVLQSLSQERMIDGHAIAIKASIGYCLYEDVSMTDRDIMIAADSALYRAKRGGKNSYCG